MEAALALDYKVLYEEQKAQNEALQLTVSTLRHELDQLKKMIYGSRHERFIPESLQIAQLTLGLAMETVAPETQTKEVAYTKIITDTTKHIDHPGRSPLPAHLRREETILEPHNIPEGSKKIGEEVTEELEFNPGELFVKKYIRPKYLLPQVSGTVNAEIIIAPMPIRPFEKAIAGPGLLAQVVIDKFADHLPLYRQMQRFERAGVKIAYSTLTDWVSGTCNLITPLYEALKGEVLQSGYVHVDETPIKVLDSDKKGKTHRGYFWVYNNSPGKMVFFDYRDGRDSKGPDGILKEYKGYLQTDGYQVYDSFDQKEGITLFHCMAHARRYFVEARDNDNARADYVLERMQQLYAIERSCKEKELDYDQRKEIRIKEALPILQSLSKWMKEQYVQTLPKSPIGKALAYSIERWDKLCFYTTNGMLNIDNNPVENSIRPVAIGRKNYLFCGSHEAARRSAMLYSLLGTCKMNGINPVDWLKDVLERIPAHPMNKIKELLPHKYYVG
jgi:transposase